MLQTDEEKDQDRIHITCQKSYAVKIERGKFDTGHNYCQYWQCHLLDMLGDNHYMAPILTGCKFHLVSHKAP